jgi:hypothetical protein
MEGVDKCKKNLSQAIATVDAIRTAYNEKRVGHVTAELTSLGCRLHKYRSGHGWEPDYLK